jgi:hypothetical protein
MRNPAWVRSCDWVRSLANRRAVENWLPKTYFSTGGLQQVQKYDRCEGHHVDDRKDKERDQAITKNLDEVARDQQICEVRQRKIPALVCSVEA